jgi:hypothetical protein
MLRAGTLTHGGIMVNYQCGAACRHCLYSCSPDRRPGYVDEGRAEEICRFLIKGGCYSVHIGGGEPFLNFERLAMMVRKLNKAGIALEYTETNAYWAADISETESIKEKLKLLLSLGANTLCISVDPFHAEYVPYGAPLILAELCEKTGMDYFLWKREFLPALSRLDSKKTHSRPNLEKILSENYIRNTARLYGIGYGGRAVNIEREFGDLYSADRFASDAAPCRNLLSAAHFHVDMDCHFIPSRCTGIRIPLPEAVDGIPPGKYPGFEALYSGGVSSLFELALRHGFSPDRAGYPSKCNLCFYLRYFLAGNDCAEFDINHYEEALKHY